jgi:predicted transport protein
MPIFNIRQNKLEKVREIPFKNEKEIQSLVEESLKDVLGLEFVRSEFELHKLRIDTLAFDNESKAFVIIEFKKDKNFSVIDQGYAYLQLLLNNKADFILEYNEHRGKGLKRDDVDWSQSKVIFISTQFTNYQKQAINFRDLPIELYEVAKYDNGLVSINQLKSAEISESINVVSHGSSVVREVSKEIKVYTEEDHLSGMLEEIREFYEDVKTRILNIGDGIEVRPKKYYIGFIAATNFVDVHVQKGQIKLWLNMNKGELDDPRKMARDVSNVGHWGNGQYEIPLKIGDDLDYLMTLIKQSHAKNK